MCGPNFETINDVLFEIVSGIVSDFDVKKQKFTKKDICEVIKQTYPDQTVSQKLLDEIIADECEKSDFFVS